MKKELMTYGEFEKTHCPTCESFDVCSNSKYFMNECDLFSAYAAYIRVREPMQSCLERMYADVPEKAGVMSSRRIKRAGPLVARLQEEDGLVYRYNDAVDHLEFEKHELKLIEAGVEKREDKDLAVADCLTAIVHFSTKAKSLLRDIDEKRKELPKVSETIRREMVEEELIYAAQHNKWFLSDLYADEIEVLGLTAVHFIEEKLPFNEFEYVMWRAGKSVYREDYDNYLKDWCKRYGVPKSFKYFY